MTRGTPPPPGNRRSDPDRKSAVASSRWRQADRERIFDIAIISKIPVTFSRVMFAPEILATIQDLADYYKKRDRPAPGHCPGRCHHGRALAPVKARDMAFLLVTPNSLFEIDRDGEAGCVGTDTRVNGRENFQLFLIAEFLKFFPENFCGGCARGPDSPGNRPGRPQPWVFFCRTFVQPGLHEVPGTDDIFPGTRQEFSAGKGCIPTKKPPVGNLVQQSLLRPRLYLFSLNHQFSEVIIRKNAESGPERKGGSPGGNRGGHI